MRYVWETWISVPEACADIRFLLALGSMLVREESLPWPLVAGQSWVGDVGGVLAFGNWDLLGITFLDGMAYFSLCCCCNYWCCI